MIVKTRYAGDREVRWADHTQDIIARPGPFAASGVQVDAGSAVGLPAMGRAIRLVAGLIGVARICVYQGRKGDKQEQPTSTQAKLIDAPYPELPDFEWRYDIAASLEVCENAFLRKIRTTRGKLVALQPIPPRFVNGYLDRNGDKAFEISTPQGWVKARPGEILHIRGQTPEGGAFGVSRIHQHRDPLGSQLAAMKFEGAYFRNHARPDIALVFPERITQAQANEWKDYWTSQYGGAANAGQAIPLGGGADIKPIPMNMRDAQFIESRQLNVEDIGRIMDVESLLLGSTTQEQQDTDAFNRFLALQLPPRLARITSALKADPDLFPDGTPLYPEFDLDPLTFASPTTKSAVQHQQIQAGTLLPDEARADNGRPPLPEGLGQIPQVVPVGGAPNPDPLPTAADNSSQQE